MRYSGTAEIDRGVLAPDRGCRRVMITAPHTVEVVAGEVGSPGPREVIARTVVSGISQGTEPAWFTGTAAALHRRWDPDGRYFRAGPGRGFPVAPGYETLARVSEVGAAVTGVGVGDLVALDRAHADVHVVAEETAVAGRLPAGTAPERALFFILARVALGGVHDAAIAVGDVVVVMGLGVVGLLAAQQARLSGARVIGVDRYPLRVAAAEALGVTAVLAGPEVTRRRRSAPRPGRPAWTRRSRRPAATPGCTRRSAACGSVGG